VAHRPGSLCATTNPETAEHYNAKMRMADLLGAQRSLRIATKCRAGHPIVAVWNVGMWTRAVPEMRVGNRRPDVVLVKDSDSGSDFEVAAVEVLRSHAVDQEKAADLAALGLRWVEVTAAVALAWDGESPLPVCNFDGESWIEFDDECGKCREIAERYKESRRRFEFERRRSEYRANVKSRIAEVALLRKNPPKIHIAVAIAMSNNPGAAAVGTVLMRQDRPVRTALIDSKIGNGSALWLALWHAIERLEAVSPGTAAVFHVNDNQVAGAAMRPRYPVERESEVEIIRRRVSETVERRGHLVWVDSTRRTPLSTGATWILKAQEAARAELLKAGVA